MRIVVRCIYRKPVTPSCDIIDMDDITWKEFFHVVRKRKELVLRLLNKEYLMNDVRELAWIPLDNQDKIGVIEEGKVVRTARTMPLNPKKRFSKEEIIAFRQATLRRMLQLGEPKERAQQELDMDEEPNIEHWTEIMQYHTPESWAELLLM